MGNGTMQSGMGTNSGIGSQQSRLPQNLIQPSIQPLPGHQNRPGSAGPMPPAAQRPKAPASRFLPSNMPCSLEGIQAIQHFKAQLIKTTVPDKQAFMNAVFESARGRVMHGWPASTMPEGEQDLPEETSTMKMIETIVKQFANPNYVKPNARVMTPRATPKPEEKQEQGNDDGRNTEMMDVDVQTQSRDQSSGDPMSIDG